MKRGTSRWALALAAALLAAEAAVLLLRPRTGIIEPARVSAGSYFTAAEIARGRDYTRPALALAAGQLLLQGGVLVLLVVRPPGRLRRAASARRPLALGAVAGGAMAVALTVVALPLGAITHGRAVDAGLSTQTWGAWALDVAKSTGIEALLAAGGAALALTLMRRLPRGWWLPGAAAVILVGALFLFAGPVLLDPVFNRFTPLKAGRTRDDVLALARAAGVRVDRVLEVDASRRTTAANAYVTGLGATKRVVLFDTLLERFSREEVGLVVAHELGHVHYRDVPRGLLFLALVAPLGTLAVQRLSWRLSSERGTAAALPALVLALALVATPIGWLSNALSRRIEARADSFSLVLTGAATPFVSSERRLALQGRADPDPPPWLTWLFGTHPPTVERIGAAVAYERGVRAGTRQR